MCTRYYTELSPELRPIIEAAAKSALADRMVRELGKPVRAGGEVRPTDIAPVIATSPRGSQAVYPMIWGFVLPDQDRTKRSQPLINARSESAHWKPTFRESWERRRCVIPASYYFEWEHIPGDPSSENGSSRRRAGQKYAIQPKGESVTWLAGLYRIEDGYPHFTVLTRKPEGDVSAIHDRMPVILPEKMIRSWIRPDTEPAELKAIVSASLTDLILERTV